MRWLCLCTLLGACVTFESHPVDELGTLRDSCVVLLHMDELAWTGAPDEVVNACGATSPGTLSGAATTVASGVRGRAGSFAGAGCIEIADAPVLRAREALTLSAWVFPTAQNGVDAFGVISKRIDINTMSAYSLYLWQQDHAYADLEGNDNRFNGDIAIPDNTWTQITLVYDGRVAEAMRARLYVNGKMDGIAKAETAAQLSPFTAPLRVGCMPAVDPMSGMMLNQSFIGQLDEVAVWTRVLSDEEIAHWYEQTKP